MSLTRRRALGMIGAATVAAGHAPRTYAQTLAYDLRPQPVANGVWMIEGSTEYFSKDNGGAIVNCALLQGESGLIVVDTGASRRYGEALGDAARGIDLRGVSTVINTHHHPDHFFGNQVFIDKPLMALAETQVEAFTHGPAFSDNMYRILGDWMRGTEVTPPNAVLEPGPQRIDGREMTVFSLSGHTAADLALLDNETGILIAGDLVFFDRAPTTPSADIALWQASLDTLETIDASAIIPGHGKVDPGGASLTQTRAYLDWLDRTLRDAAGEGLDMIEIMALPLPEQFADMGAQPEEFHRSISHLFPEIERQVLPRAN